MPLAADAVAWARPRVQNFTDGYARKLIRELVELGGETFDKVRFFGVLVDAGVLKEPEIKDGKTKEDIYAKRWDSYLAPIRPFGLGFTVEEKRTQSPNPARLVWRPSHIAYNYDAGDIDHREFMALQLARSQFPKVTMPLKEPAKAQLQAGAAIQPLRLFVEVIDRMRAADLQAVLTHGEICQLARCKAHRDVVPAVDEIAAHRAGRPTPNWRTDEPGDLDILLNDLVATGYFSRPTADVHKALVPVYARWAEAQALIGSLDWIDVTTNVGIEQYYERLMSSASDDERAILGREQQAINLEASEATLADSQLTGPADVIAGLQVGTEVFVPPAGRVVRVVQAAADITRQAGTWQATARVVLAAFLPSDD